MIKQIGINLDMTRREKEINRELRQEINEQRAYGEGVADKKNREIRKTWS